MARQQTMKQMLSFFGPLRWQGRLVSQDVCGNPQTCRWGFVAQDKFKGILQDTTVHERLEMYYKIKDSHTNHMHEAFEKRHVDFDEFLGGAESAYVELKDHFLNPDIDFRDINLTAPRLSLFLNDCVDGYIENEHLEPRLKIDNIQVTVQDLTQEFGNVDHMDKVFGLYDLEEVRYHLLSGSFPELTLGREMKGDTPRRLAASVLYRTREKFWFADKEDEPENWQESLHLLEYESPTADAGLGWRLRNFNKAIKTI